MAYKSPSKTIRKTNLQPISNKVSPWAYMELEFDVIGVAKKLPIYVIYLFQKRKEFISLFLWCPKSKQDVFYLKEF
jgi:hypothetical protein